MRIALLLVVMGIFTLSSYAMPAAYATQSRDEGRGVMQQLRERRLQHEQQQLPRQLAPDGGQQTEQEDNMPGNTAPDGAGLPNGDDPRVLPGGGETTPTPGTPDTAVGKPETLLDAIRKKIERQRLYDQFCAARPHQSAEEFVRSNPGIQSIYPIAEGVGSPRWMAGIPKRWTEGQIANLQRFLRYRGISDYRGQPLTIDGKYGVRTMSAHMAYFQEAGESPR